MAGDALHKALNQPDSAPRTNAPQMSAPQLRAPPMAPPPAGKAAVPAASAVSSPSAVVAPRPAAPVPDPDPRPTGPAPKPISMQVAPQDFGSTLYDLLKKGPMSLESALARVGLVAETVALQRTTVHGALTPWHVRFDSADATGKPKIAPPEAVTDAAHLAPYRAPELEKNEQEALTTPSAEVYALGCMLFQAIAGRTPFVGPPADQAKRHATAAAPPLRMVRRDCELPPALEVEIQRALKKRPGDRHATAAAFAAAIRAANREDDRATMALSLDDSRVLQDMMGAATSDKIASGKMGHATNAANPAIRGGAAAVGPQVPITEMQIAGGPVAPPQAAKKGNPILLVSLAAIVLLGVGLAYMLLKSDPPPPAAAAPAVAPAVKADAPDVTAAPDVPANDTAAEPDLPPDLPPEVAPEPDVEAAAPAKTGKVRPPKTDKKATPDVPPKEDKKEDKKKDGPAVF